MATRRDFFRGAGAVAVTGALGFPSGSTGSPCGTSTFWRRNRWAFVDALFAVLAPIVVQSRTAQYGVPDRQLGSQLTTPPDYGYLQAYWSGPTLDLCPF